MKIQNIQVQQNIFDENGIEITVYWHNIEGDVALFI
jgi:hypothetical protein